MRNLTKTLASDVIELGGIALHWWRTVGSDARYPQDISAMRIGQIEEQISRARSVVSKQIVRGVVNGIRNKEAK